jgi:GTP-binding protein
MHFLDQAKIYLKSGAGGPGAVSFRREKFIEYGGPDGGEGGKGGDISCEAVAVLKTLIEFSYTQQFRAPRGKGGSGSNRTGGGGDDLVIKVPVGTQVLADDEERTLLADLTQVGQRVTLLKGGDGGRGNASYKTSTNRAPRQHGSGWPGEEMWVWLRLKLLADVGLVGLPNAGKSTFLNSTTNAAAKVGEYPFTTLRPQLGVARHKGREFVVADIPGLIEGAAEGAGIGDRFLGHVERCRLLLHLVDAAGDDPVEAWRVVRGELDAYGADLAGKPEVVALSRSDLVDAKQLAKVRKALETATGGTVIPISAPTGDGIETLLDAIVGRLGADEAQPAKAEAGEQPWSPL